MALAKMPTADQIANMLETARQWIEGTVAAELVWQQLGVALLALIPAWIVAVPLRKRIDRIVETLDAAAKTKRIGHTLSDLVLPALWLFVLSVGLVAARQLELPHEFIRVIASLLSAWIVIHTLTTLIRDRGISRTVAIVVWIVAALNIVRLLDPVVGFLDGFAIKLGETRVSPYLILKGLALSAAFLWCAVGLGSLFQQRIEKLPNLTPSIRVLMTQSVRFTLVMVAFVLAMTAIGVDLTAFAVFGGALGVGIGFGLQKVVSNLVCGVILLLDRSIKPGDVLQVGETYGTLHTLGARYASVITRDGIEFLIPNEDLITQQVVNWSFSDKLVRRKIPIGISYRADIDLATRLMLESARESPRILNDPPPNCLLTGFGDSSVDFELRVWIADPEAGVGNVADDVLRRVWHRFKDNGVEIPFPQRDVHIKQPAELVVRTENPGP
jgi:small-conductance mechanosensitive channel